MPRYFFHLIDKDHISDDDGTELADLDAAREHAVAVVREITFKRDELLDIPWSEWTMSVRDHSGNELFALPLSDIEHKPIR